MRRLVVAVVALAAATVNGCSSPSESPTGPSQTVAPSSLSRSAASFDAAQLDASEAILDAADGAEAAATVNLSGIWKGTLQSGGSKKAAEFNLKHTGKTIAGKLTKYQNQPVPKGFSATLTLTETSVKGSKRTYESSLKMIESGGKCTPTTLKGTLVIDTMKKIMTGTLTGKNTDCKKDTPSFNLKKS